MMATLIEAPAAQLERRLAHGAEVLFDMEQRGDTGADYARWLEAWTRLLEQYSALEDAELEAA
jgi:hypothetical protein